MELEAKRVSYYYPLRSGNGQVTWALSRRMNVQNVEFDDAQCTDSILEYDTIFSTRLSQMLAKCGRDESARVIIGPDSLFVSRISNSANLSYRQRASFLPKSCSFFRNKPDGSTMHFNGYSVLRDHVNSTAIHSRPSAAGFDFDRHDEKGVQKGQSKLDELPIENLAISAPAIYGKYFENTVATLLRSLLSKIARSLPEEAHHVLNSFSWGRYVSVACMLPCSFRDSISVAVLVPSQEHPRIAVCVGFTRSAETKTHPLAQASCSCWRDSSTKSCVHTMFCFESELILAGVHAILSQENIPVKSVPHYSNQSDFPTDKWSTLPCIADPGVISVYWICFLERCAGSCRVMYVPVLEQCSSRNSKKDILHRMQCQKCRRSPTKRGVCEHERAVLECRKELLHLGYGTAVKTLGRDVLGESDGENEISNNSTIAPLTSEIVYVSWRKRRWLPCQGDLSCTKELNDRFWICRERREMVSLRDEIVVCKHCRMSGSIDDTSMAFEQSYRKVLVHTFVHGTFDACVTDFVCGHCFEMNFFDGLDIACFSASKCAVYTRELLDYWLFQVASLGQTFRDAYFASQGFAQSSSVSQVRIGREIRTNRRAANSCFSEFLKTLFPEDDQGLSQIFTCNICEEGGRMKGVVMDGTATGILGDLPKFTRPSIGIPSPRNVSVVQFLLQEARYRRFIKAFTKQALVTTDSPVFKLKLCARYRGEDEYISDIIELFFFNDDIQREPFAFSEYLRAAYEVLSTREYIQCSRKRAKTDAFRANSVDVRNMHAQVPSSFVDDRDSDRCNSDQAPAGKDDRIFIIFRHRLPTERLRRASSDFLRCFLTDSLPASIMHRKESVKMHMVLAERLASVFECSHEGQPCKECRFDVESSANRAEDVSATASGFALALMESMGRESNAHLREISLAVACVIDEAVEAYKSFDTKFQKERSKASALYSANHSNGNSFIGEVLGASATDTPVMTGELYPGRPQCRPRVHFLNSNAHPEVSRDECTKNYRNSMSHSPGLFTVQCVCAHPKILGVPIMDSCESLSTALSALITRFQTLPKAVFYDNACNLSKSIMLRCPWVLKDMNLCVDRFHFKSHACSSSFDPATFSSLDNLRTSGAESLNARWANSRSHIRFLQGSNLMPFVTAKAAFMNLKALYRDESDTADIEDTNLIAFGNGILACSCHRCATAGGSDGN